MTREEFIGKLRSIYVGEENAIDEIISEYDRLNNIINELEKDLNEAYDELHRGELVNGRELINNIYQDLKELKEDNK